MNHKKNSLQGNRKVRYDKDYYSRTAIWVKFLKAEWKKLYLHGLSPSVIMDRLEEITGRSKQTLYEHLKVSELKKEVAGKKRTLGKIKISN